MLGPLAALVIGGVALTIFSMVLARIIPDRYDHLEFRKADAPRR